MNAMTGRLTPVTITELAPSTRIALRIADPAAFPLLALPGRIGTRAGAGALSALCLGPDEWLLETTPAQGAVLVASLDDLATRVAVSAVDVSDRELTLALEGPAVLDLLATGCPRDLGRLPVSAGTRTVFDTAQVVLTREAGDRFHLTVWRSFAPHVRALLDIAAREIAVGL